MCWFLSKKRKQVSSVYNSDGELIDEKQNDTEIDLPEHVDNLILNRNVHNGTLGFRYKNKDATVIVYSSIEARTFCLIMHLSPLP